MPAEGTQDSLQTILAQELQCTERLLTVLEAERAALTSRDIEALEQSTRDKHEHARQLEQWDSKRQAMLGGLGFGSGMQGLQQCFAGRPDADTLNSLWKRILRNLATCRNSNLTNGGILEANREHVERALGILRGQPGAASLYNPDGDTSMDLGRRELGKV